MAKRKKPKPLSQFEHAALDDAVKREGFLSASTTTVIEHCRADHAEWFELAEGLNRFCMHLLWSLDAKRENDQQMLAAVLFGRCVSAFQGAALFAERGMILEARYVLRALLETTFALAAAAKKKRFPEAYMHDDNHRLVKMINACLRLPPEMKAFHRLDEAELRQTKRVAMDAIKAKDSRPLKVAEIADQGGMTSHYDTIYRVLSTTAHASVRDLDYHIIATPDEQSIDRFGWGPRTDKADDALMQACDSLLIGAAHVLHVFERPQLENPYSALHRRFEHLIKRA
jgi:hypothetical protein